MIQTLTLAAVAVLFLVFSALCFRAKATLERRLSAVAMMFVAVGLAIAAPILMPDAIRREASAAAEAEQLKLAAEVARVRALSEALGGPQAYLEYLTVTKQE